MLLRTFLNLLIFRNIRKIRLKLYSMLLSLLSLNAHDFINRFPDIELRDIPPELSGFNLGVVKKVLHDVKHEVG